MATEGAAGAVVTLVDGDGRQGGRTDAVDGRYRLALPGSGSWQLVVSAPGHQPQVRRLIADGARHVAEDFDLAAARV